MTAYRFRLKFEPDPSSLWRDIVVGEDRTLDEVQSLINRGFGLDREHLWFFGVDEAYWNSDVKYQRPKEYEELPSGGGVAFGEEVYNAGETTVGQMVRQLGLEQYDRICYLYDYGDEWRFYGILKEVLEDESDEKEPVIVKEKGTEITDQYGWK